MGLGAPEVVASQEPQSLAPIQTSADSINNTPATTGNLRMQTRMHAANLIAVQNIGQAAQSQEANHQIPEAPASPVIIHLPNAATSLPLIYHVYNGQNFNVGGQLVQNHPTSVHAWLSQASIDITKQSEGIQNTQNFLPLYPIVQTQGQALKGL